jgi:hypothetical protein
MPARQQLVIIAGHPADRRRSNELSKEVDMKKILIPAVAGIALVAATLADAAEATGTIKAVDAANHTVTLEDNRVYTFPAGVDLSQLKAGIRVKVTFTTDASGTNNATALAGAS